MAIHVQRAWLLLTAAALSAQVAPVPNANNTRASAQTLIGHGWGVDHIGIGVRDLTQARHDYEQLGFKVSVGGHFPGGLSNCAVSLPKNGYLELLSVTGGAPVAHSDAAEVADFVKKHEGAMFLGIDISSAKAAADSRKKSATLSCAASGSDASRFFFGKPNCCKVDARSVDTSRGCITVGTALRCSVITLGIFDSFLFSCRRCKEVSMPFCCNATETA